MCGLAGRFHPRALQAAPGWAARADALLAHRGPDGAGHFADARCELVHRRLALVDLSPAGAQPMTDETGDLQLVFNGEIYNHRVLRRELRAAGHHFRGTSDTEVIVHLYEELGAECVRALRGIFAFALYDRRRGTLLLARDRFGVKPLFVAGPLADGEWVFASELKAILAHPAVPRRLDRQACYDFLGLGFVPEPRTGFVDIAAVMPGATITVAPDRVRHACLAPVVARPDPAQSLHGAVAASEALLMRAVTAQAEADVPVAALLSGGIDSSLVVAAHRRAHGAPPATFSVAFPDASADESDAARAVAAHCGAAHQAVRADDGLASVDEALALIRHFDQPFADLSCLPTHWVARALHDAGYRCALSGDGGDEAFGGYPRFWQGPQLLWLAQAPGWLRSAGGAGARALRPIWRDGSRRLTRAAALATEAHLDASRLLAGLSSYLTEGEKRALVADDARAGLEPAHRLFAGGEDGPSDVEGLSRRMTDTLFRLTLPSDMLRKVDMMSMRTGVELRVPLLDDSLVDLGLSLPHRLKTDGRRGKVVLRELAERWLPRAVARAPKHGFDLPLGRIATPAFRDAIDDLLGGPGSRTAAVLSRPVVAEWRDRFAGRRGHDAAATSQGTAFRRLFGLLSLELWMREHQLAW